MRHLQTDDPEVARIIEQEKNRLENTLDLIAAESYPKQRIRFIMKTIKTHFELNPGQNKQENSHAY